MDATELLAPGLLAGERIAVSGACGPFGTVIARALASLGARLVLLDADRAVEALADELGAEGVVVDPLDEDAVGAAAQAAGPVSVLACDASRAGADPLREALDGSWLAMRAFANASMIPAQAGKVVMVGPAPTGPDAEAIRAALENMARTLSIEWSRHGIRIVALQPVAAGAEARVATLVAYLASPAGDYYSGCALPVG